MSILTMSLPLYKWYSGLSLGIQTKLLKPQVVLSELVIEVVYFLH